MSFLRNFVFGVLKILELIGICIIYIVFYFLGELITCTFMGGCVNNWSRFITYPFMAIAPLIIIIIMCGMLYAIFRDVFKAWFNKNWEWVDKILYKFRK